MTKKKGKAKGKKAAAVIARIPAQEQNGVKRPREGGVCRAVWDALDAVVSKGAQPTARDVRELVEKKGWNQNNASIELSRWRKFNGITARAT